MSAAPVQFQRMMFAGWANRRQLAMIDYLKAENLVLRQQLGGGSCGSPTTSAAASP